MCDSGTAVEEGARHSFSLPALRTIPVRLTVFLLAVDAVLLGMFLLWAYAAHHRATAMWIYGQSMFSLGEGELYEQWGFVKLTVAITMAVMIARSRQEIFFWGLCALLIVMLLSDALELHERINAGIATFTAGRIGAIDIDPLTKLLLAASPLAVMARGLMASRTARRCVLIGVAMPTLMLGGWTAVADLLHALYAASFGGSETIATLIEEGGEGILATLIVAVLAGLWKQERRRGEPAAVAAS